MRKSFQFFLLILFAAMFAPSLASAATTPIILPSATGTYSQWTPSTGSTHYTMVDESACNGTTDYVTTSTTGQRDAFVALLSSIPDNSTITNIAIVPCASRASGGGGSATLNVFYRYNGTNGSDLGSYALSGTTPVALATSTWGSLTLTKTSTSTLEIGAIYSSGTKGARLSRIATEITYGVPPSATTSAASSITTTSALLNGTGNPNGTTTTAWFRIDTTSPGTCNDTFGTRVPSSGSTALGAGTSSVAYSTTTASLTQNTTYYYCAIASNGYGKGYGTVQSFTTSPLVTTISSNITTNQTWTTASGTYLISGARAINTGITLTIDPGVIVKFESTGASLTVNGTLTANGTLGNLIYLTSYKDDTVGGDGNGDAGASSPATGDWGNIKINSGGTATLNYTTTRYGGYSTNYANFHNNGGILSIATSTIDYGRADGIRQESGTTTVASSTISNNDYGIDAWGGSLSVYSSLFLDNTTHAVVLDFQDGLQFMSSENSGEGGIKISSTIATDVTLASGLPYVMNAATVSSGKTLTISPGVIVKFEVSSSGLTVNGTVDAVGSSPLPIYFTSYKDDSIGGDTNGDATSTSPAAGNWSGIKVNSGGTATLIYTVTRYAGYSSSANLHNNGGTLAISTSTVALSSSYGVYHAGGTTTLVQSVIEDNSSYGLYNSTSATTTAENNYWGDWSGPYHPTLNSGGTGNAASDYVDFSPWLGQTGQHFIHYGYAVNVSTHELRWGWGATSTQYFSIEWDAGVNMWNELGAINIVEATSTTDMEVWETNDLTKDRAVYFFNDNTLMFEINFNRAFMTGNPEAVLQKTTAHELGHALALDHSYWDNIMYFASSTHNYLGDQDVVDYDYCWIDNSQCP
jgi:hypothetical protein